MLWASTESGGMAMVKLELTPDEASMLATMLSSALSDLRLEIAGTEKKEWRDELHKHEVFLNTMLARLAPAPA